MTEFSFPIAIALSLGITDVSKRVFPSLRRFAPLVSLACAIAFYLGFNGVSMQSLLDGAVAGLSAVGAFSSTRSLARGVIERMDKEPPPVPPPA